MISIQIGTWPPRAQTRGFVSDCRVKLFLRWKNGRVDRIRLGESVDRMGLRARLRKAHEIAEAIADLAGTNVKIEG